MHVYRCEKITKDSISQNVSEKVKLKVPQLCPILHKPMDYPVHGILQVRILEWVAFPFSGDLPNPGIEPRSPTLLIHQLSHQDVGEDS